MDEASTRIPFISSVCLKTATLFWVTMFMLHVRLTQALFYCGSFPLSDILCSNMFISMVGKSLFHIFLPIRAYVKNIISNAIKCAHEVANHTCLLWDLNCREVVVLNWQIWGLSDAVLCIILSTKMALVCINYCTILLY